MHETAPAAGPPSYDERFDDLAALSYRIAFRMLGSSDDARDVAQEALARAYSRWPRVRDRAGGWVGRVTTNLALDHLRRHRRPVPPVVPAGAADPAGVASLRTDLVAALRRLPRRQRDVVVLRYLADLPESEVAAALGCSAGTVKQHAHRGLAALRTALEPRTGDEPAVTGEAADTTPAEPTPTAATATAASNEPDQKGAA